LPAWSVRDKADAQQKTPDPPDYLGALERLTINVEMRADGLLLVLAAFLLRRFLLVILLLLAQRALGKQTCNAIQKLVQPLLDMSGGLLSGTL
jgi:hypothetical protein